MPANIRYQVQTQPMTTPAESPPKKSADGPPCGAANSLQNLHELGQTQNPPLPPSNIHTLNIVGQIEGHMVLPPQNKSTKYEHVIPQLVAIEQNPQIEGLLITLNTVGGDVEAGLAIAEMIKSMNKPSVSLVLGGGHSIGVPIAVCTDYSFIVRSATMTIHPLRLTGLVIGVPQTYEYMNKMQDRIVKFVTSNSRISEKKFRDLMFNTGELTQDVGTVLVGRDAVKEKLINEIGGISEAIAKLKELIEEKKALETPEPLQ